jgi:hypothetical protein
MLKTTFVACSVRPINSMARCYEEISPLGQASIYEGLEYILGKENNEAVCSTD